MGYLDDAQETVDAALDVAEQFWLPDLLSQALNTAGLIAAQRGRLEQGYALVRRALEIALGATDESAEALRAYNNLSDMLDPAGPLRRGARAAHAGSQLLRRGWARGTTNGA